MELFRIADGRAWFYQWDLNQKIYVNDPAINEVHFCNGTSDCSLVVKVHEGLAEVPNILLQMARNIKVYAVNVDHTCGVRIFEVRARSKPADYVYTETEIKRYEDLEKQIEEVKRSIPSVPVKSVNGKTGEVQLSAADVGALPSDTPIPAPYSLPTASEDVKGGVKVGKGLQMDGDVLGVVPEGYELIEVITLKEDMLIDNNQTADGEPYSFKAVRVKAKNDGKLISHYSNLYFISENNEVVGDAYYSAISDTKRIYRLDDIYQSGGYWESVWFDWSSNGSTATLNRNYYSRMLLRNTRENKRITRIRSSAAIPAGIYEIWAVRA